MHVNLGSRWAIPIALMASVAVATPTLADFGPTRVVRTTSPGHDLDVTDNASDGGTVALTWDEDKPSGRRVYLGWSTDRGATWQRRRIDTRGDPGIAGGGVRRVRVWAINRLRVPDSPPSECRSLARERTDRPRLRLRELRADTSTVSLASRTWPASATGRSGRRLAPATASGYKVLVHSRGVIDQPKGDEVEVLRTTWAPAGSAAGSRWRRPRTWSTSRGIEVTSSGSGVTPSGPGPTTS